MALSSFADDPMALLTACRQLLHRRPESSPLMWLSARMLTALDPREEAWAAVVEIESDATGRRLVLSVPDDARVAVAGRSALIVESLLDRDDVVVDLDPQPTRLADSADLLVIEAVAAGAGQALVPPGAAALARHARDECVAVWLVLPVGCVLPDLMFESFRIGLQQSAGVDLVAKELIDKVVRPQGLLDTDPGFGRADCAVAAELLARR